RVSKESSVVRFRVQWPFGTLAFGYYNLKISLGGATQQTFIISAPRKIKVSYQNKKWGVFSPLYALRSNSDWGIGSISELEKTQKFIVEQGGDFVGTLPLLATCDNENHFDPSPYSPSSRLFWNEIYLNIS